MENLIDPALSRGLLRAEIRKAREAVGLTQREAAQRLGWSLSKVIRIESGHVGVSQSDTRALLELYEIVEDDQIGTWMTMARESRRAPWSQYRDVLNPDYVNFLGYEGSAADACYFEPLVIPGIVQGERYGRLLIESFSEGVDSEITRRLIQARHARSLILDRIDGPTMTFVIAETALHSLVGNPGSESAQREQLILLLDLNQLENVNIRILPFSFGSHPGMASGFALLRFDDPTHGDVLFQELGRPALITGQTAQIETFRALFKRLDAGSIGGADLEGIINPILERLPT